MVDTRRRRRRNGRRGVSEVVATIILLGMTVTLFAGIFLFTTHNPTAQPQPLKEFSISLTYGGTGGRQVTAVSIVHLAGQVITGSSTSQAAVYISSMKHPANISGPFTLAAGLGGSTDWDFGQTWSVSLSSYGIYAPDNLTVSVVSNQEVQFSTTVYAVVSSAAPVFTKVTVTPVSVAPGGSFNLSAYVQFSSTSGDSLKANLSEVALSNGQAMTGSGASGLFYWDGTVPSSGVSAGTYYLFLTAIDASGAKATTDIAITVT